ncbi:O-acetyl-ADP-ribose deacetylase [Aestuariicella hydrocarbonica]|uniref:O-acetyl-ADP-ribose deacetylase n=1 Tax=Pseudomaricurvus hydrocarbonicus TaxID=1470433 RepID=A0A9E5ML23_9GAMM|nr:O-acetyl-ADP-ribose deacetylase [Aestuariicella hydrocarbonica]NHO66262.1 O-acetyl-ADP-ribose deacetylase [Aestuariicella hydrocarbonica]
MKVGNNIEIKVGDITTADVDVIVNAANEKMLGGGGVDGAIHRAAGPELLAACRKVTPVDGVRCPTGQARITPAGQLKAKFVIHTVGPQYHYHRHPEALLASCYRHSLDLALEHDCSTIAFPAISCGVYGYPLKEAADIACKVCHAEKYQGLEIVFYLFDQQIASVWQSVFGAQPG